METDEETAFMGLTDIVSNLMVLFILLTVFVLTIRIHEAAQDNKASGFNGNTGGIFTSHSNSPVFGTVTYVAVMENGFGVLNWGAISTGIASRDSISYGDVIPYSGHLFIPQNGVAVQSDERSLMLENPSKFASLYVIDRFKVKFELGTKIPDWAVIPANQENTITALQQAATLGSDLSFIVYPEGMVHFVPIYEALLEQNICFRWEPWESSYKFIRESSSYLGQNRCTR